MEYCNGGDLYNALERPENYFGLPETELLLVLDHLSNIKLNNFNFLFEIFIY